MKFTPLYLTLFISVLNFQILSQPKRGDCRILFYNVENLFDVIDNPDTNDEEFLPNGDRSWSKYKFDDKINNIAKVIIAAGGWETPEIIGLCEVENRYVVEQLINQTPLKNIGYSIIHKESPDKRGIDVSMLYNRAKFEPLKYRYLEVKDSKGESLKTREILYVSGIIGEIDTIHLFFNHWSSRYSGYLETVVLRKQAAKTLRSEIDKLFLKNPDSKIIIMGDFNDQPTDESIVKILKVEPNIYDIDKGGLVNLSARWGMMEFGTMKYQSQWQIFDQIIVSTGLMNPNNTIYCTHGNATVFNQDFLLKKDDTYGGFKPFRTFNGYRFEGGYSDHLPVLLDLFFR